MTAFSSGPASAPAPAPAGRARAARAWCLYDWANSAFATSVMAAVLPPYFASVARKSLPAHLATAYWGYGSAAALLIAALLGPVLGSVADSFGRRKPLLLACVVAGSAATAAIAFAGSWLALLTLYGVAFVAFALGNVLYDSLLPAVATPAEYHRVSARGFAYGYLGGGLLLAINLAWILRPALFHIESVGAATRLSIASVALWWLGFSLPLMRDVREPSTGGPRASAGRLAGAVLLQLRDALGGIRRSPELLRFLIAFWIYSDGIGTVVKMASIYGSEIGIGTGDLIGALLMVQILAAPASLVFGRLARPLGPRLAVALGLAGYAGITVVGFFMSHAWHFWLMAGLVAMFQGGTQALSRSMFAQLAPRGRLGVLFGFYSVSEKLAGVVGPLLFGAVAQVSGTGRIAVLTLLPSFIFGAWLLLTVDLNKGTARALAASPAD